MTEYHVRSRPGGTTVRVSRPGGVTRVRTRLLGGGGGGGGGGAGDRKTYVFFYSGTPATFEATEAWGAGNVYDPDVLTLSQPLDAGYRFLIQTGEDLFRSFTSDGTGIAPVDDPQFMVGAIVDPADPTGLAFWSAIDELTDLNPARYDSFYLATAETATTGHSLTPWAGRCVAAGGGTSLSDAVPQDLGTAAAGDGTAAARDDHVHAMPSAADVGAIPNTAAGTDGDLVNRVTTVEGVPLYGGISPADFITTNDIVVGSDLGDAAALDVGTTAGTVAAGDDARLSDTRTPSSTLAHKSSHATAGSDALAPSDIGAVPTTRTINGYDLSANRTLTAADVGAVAGTPVVASTKVAATIPYGTPLYPPVATGGTVALGVGDMVAISAVGATVTLAKVGYEISATSATSGQVCKLGCYAVNTDGSIGTLTWSEDLPADSAAGVMRTLSTTRAVPELRAWVILNPNANAGTVTFRAWFPHPSHVGLSSAYHNRFGFGLAASITALPSDLSAYKFNDTDSAGSSYWGHNNYLAMPCLVGVT